MEQLQLSTLNGINSKQLPDVSLTPQHQKEQLESLLYQKVQRGEDVSSLLKVLHYLTSTDTREDQFQKIWAEVIKERSAFNSLQRVIITAFAALGMIAFLNGVLKSGEPTQAVINPPAAQQR